jgi:hypothetical protein
VDKNKIIQYLLNKGFSGSSSGGTNTYFINSIAGKISIYLLNDIEVCLGADIDLPSGTIPFMKYFKIEGREDLDFLFNKNSFLINIKYSVEENSSSVLC